MERGAPHLFEMMRTGIDNRLKALAPFGEPRAMYVPDTRLIGLVVTRIQVARGGYTNDHTQHLRSLRRHWEDALVEPYIHQGVGVPESLSSGLPVYNFPHTQNVGGRHLDDQYTLLTHELKRRIDAYDE